MNQDIETRVSMEKFYLSGEIITAIARATGQVTPINSSMVSDLVESCDAGIRYRVSLNGQPPVEAG